jgi:hypothetical protein
MRFHKNKVVQIVPKKGGVEKHHCGEGWEFVDQLIPHSFTELKISLRGYDEPIGCPWA